MLHTWCRQHGSSTWRASGEPLQLAQQGRGRAQQQLGTKLRRLHCHCCSRGGYMQCVVRTNSPAAAVKGQAAGVGGL